MINWKTLNDHTPTNVKKSSFVTCLVWVCNPDVVRGGVRGGVIDVVRWDTKYKCWCSTDMVGKWMHKPPYRITHFCDDINIPNE